MASTFASSDTDRGPRRVPAPLATTTAALLVLAVMMAAGRSVHAQEKPARPLTSAQQRAVERELARFADAPGERASLIAIAKLGEPARRHLEALLVKDPARGEISKLLAALDHLEGRDLLKQDLDVTPWPWSLRTFATGEIVLLEALGRWAAIRVDPSRRPGSETLPVEVILTSDRLLPLGGPGVSREKIEAKGELAVVNDGKIRAYPSRDYTFEVLGAEIVLRSAGAEGFRYRHHPGSLPAAFTGERDPKRVKAGDPRYDFRDRPDVGARKNARRIQQYLYRILEGVDPLPTYGTPDEPLFAHAEHVQVEVREDTDGSRVVLVAFPHMEDVPFDADVFFLLAQFAEQAGGYAARDLLVWSGNQEAHEVNRYWNGKAFAKPSPDLVKRVRRLFPEDY